MHRNARTHTLKMKCYGRGHCLKKQNWIISLDRKWNTTRTERNSKYYQRTMNHLRIYISFLSINTYRTTQQKKKSLVDEHIHSKFCSFYTKHYISSAQPQGSLRTKRYFQSTIFPEIKVQLKCFLHHCTGQVKLEPLHC